MNGLLVTPTRFDPPPLADRMLLALASAEDVADGMAQVLDLLRRSTGTARLEWWAPADDGSSLRLEAAAGSGGAVRASYPMAGAGVVNVSGPETAELGAALSALAPLLRRRRAEERLAAKAVELARRNEALEDFAALVAHELKAPLHGVLAGGDPAAEAARALDLVDEILEASHASADTAVAPVADTLASALRDLGPLEATVESSLTGEAPLPAAALRLVLRNLIGNASAAGARRISVETTASAGRWTLTIDDDGVGLGGAEYAVGSRIGLALCRRMAERFGGTLELAPRAGGGTRALLVIEGGTP